MRLWSLHPKYLDGKGLVALWREALLAKCVLEGKTKGYRNHPQLERFKCIKASLALINQYLADIYKESLRRDYHFNKQKIKWNFKRQKISVTTGQMEYEKLHLLEKLKVRDPDKYKELLQTKKWETHPLFEKVNGAVEGWEKITRPIHGHYGKDASTGHLHPIPQDANCSDKCGTHVPDAASE
jgi:hypothetical protein